MNPVFYLLIIIAAIVLWFLLSFVFYPLGIFINDIVTDVKKEMERDENEKENKENSPKEGE